MKTITGIHGVPRSGTSWLAQIFNSSPAVSLKFQPLFSYAFKDFLNLESTSEDIDIFFEKIYKSEDYFINMNDKEIHKNYPKFAKQNDLEHLVFKHVRYHYLIPKILQNNSNAKFILVVRNPLAVLSSWKNAPREFNPEWDFDLEWTYANKKNQFRSSEYFGYKKWKEATGLFFDLEKEYSNRVTVVWYDQLLSNTMEEVERLFRFAGIPMLNSVADFVTKSKSKTVSGHNSVYRKKNTADDGWKQHISTDIREAIQEDLKGHFLENLM